MRAGGSGVHAAFTGLLAELRRRRWEPRLRQAVAVLMATALILAGMPAGFGQAGAHGLAAPAVVHHHHSAAVSDDSGGTTVPCGHPQPGCMSALGCLLILGILPAPLHLADTPPTAQQTYWPATATGRGITAEPVLAPPIRG
jgi:hypothetical protein